LRRGTGFGRGPLGQAIEARFQDQQPAIQIARFRTNRPQPVLQLFEFPVMTLLKLRQALNNRQHLLKRANDAGHRDLPGLPCPHALLYFIQGRVDLPDLHLHGGKHSLLTARWRFLHRCHHLPGAPRTAKRRQLVR
jgi:hypothetical protein